MTPKAKTPTNWLYLIVLAIVRLYMLGALTISFGHIITASGLLHLYGWQAYTVPFAVDGFAVLGMIGRSSRFEITTQRTGLRLQGGAGLVSLAANVYAGHTIGERIYGALIVAAFIAAEWYAGKLRPAPAAKQAGQTWTEERKAKAKATRAANRAASMTPAEKRKATIAARKAAELAAMVDGYVPANAPVSPAPAAA